MIRGYFDFINESKKEEAVEALKKMLQDKPAVTDKGKPSDSRFNDYSDRYPQKIQGIYSIADMKRHLRDKGFTTDNVDQAFHELKNDKEFDIKSISVKNYLYDENVPHFYIDMTKEEAKEIKKDLEEQSKEMNQDKIEKRKERSKKRKELTKTTYKKKK